MTLHQLNRIVRFDAAGPAKSVFFELNRLKAQVMGLEPGQRIPPCPMKHDVVFVVLEGEGEVIVDGEREPLRASSWVFVPNESAMRSIEAATKMTILAMQVR